MRRSKKTVLLSHARFLDDAPFLLTWSSGGKVDTMDFSATATSVNANVPSVKMNVYEFRRGYGIDRVLVNINFVRDYFSLRSYDVRSLNRWSRMVCKNVLVRLSGYVSLSSCFLTNVLSRGWFKTLIYLCKILLMGL